MLKVFLLGFAAWPFQNLAFAKDYDMDVAKWVVVKQPTANWDDYHNFLREAVASRHEWAVYRVDGKTKGRLCQDMPLQQGDKPDFDTTVQVGNSDVAASRTLKVGDGWICAYNRGEFGAAVYWFSADGKKKSLLSRDSVNQFMTEGSRIFAVEGLAHMGSSAGSMIEIRKEANGWRIDRLFELPGSGQAIARVAEGDYVIVTDAMLLRVNLKKEILVLIPHVDLFGLSNSVAVDDRNIYVGMRQFVARCRLSTSVQPFDLLVPDKSWLTPGEKAIEQPGAAQPATKPADKPSVKDQPSTPTSKDAPR